MTANDGAPALPQLPDGAPEAVRVVLDAVVNRSIEGFGPLRGAQKVAEEYLRGSSSQEEAVARLVATHCRLAATSGFINGVGGLASLPVAIPAGIGGLYIVSARMVVGIAHLNGYDISSDEVRSAVGVCLIGTAASGTAKNVGTEASRRFLNAALRRMSARPLQAVNRAVGFRLVTKAGSTGVVNLGRVVPVVGGAVGGAVDFAACRAIAGYARRTFPARDAQAPAG